MVLLLAARGLEYRLVIFHSGAHRRRGFSPAQLVSVSFLLLILAGTVLLLLPVSRSGVDNPEFTTALFTATSAVCLTGLTVVDTATYWSHFGQIIILVLVQIGGLGIMTLATVVSFVLAGQMGVKGRLRAVAEQRGRNLGEVRTVILGTIGFSLAVELVITVVLAIRFATKYGYALLPAVWQGGFHAISAFNNAGFGLQSNNLIPYVNDSGIILPVAAGVIVGGLGVSCTARNQGAALFESSTSAVVDFVVYPGWHRDFAGCRHHRVWHHGMDEQLARAEPVVGGASGIFSFCIHPHCRIQLG